MPTGTGKTETMLALLTRESLGRLLVIVPTNHLREQIGEKFVTLGLLKSLGVLGADAAYPVVALLERKPKTPDEVDAVFARCNVVVTTMSIAGQCTEAVQRRMAELCTHLFIDEAHHISARTWDALRKRFTERPIVQFTATPFRNDGKLVDGKVVFNYPLRKAQAEGYFKQIRFKPVDEFDLQEADQSRRLTRTGRSSSPSFDKAYSTRRGCSPKSVRITSPSASSSRRCCVNILGLTPSMSRNNTRYLTVGLANNLKRIGSFQRPLIRPRVSVTLAADPSGPRHVATASAVIGTLKCILASGIPSPLANRVR